MTTYFHVHLLWRFILGIATILLPCRAEVPNADHLYCSNFTDMICLQAQSVAAAASQAV